MRYRVRHVTTYDYSQSVDLAAHMLHLSPRVLPHQRVISARLIADPPPGRVAERDDFFGNAVTWMFLDARHQEFAVTLDALVDVGFPAPPDPSATPAWEHVDALARSGEAGGWAAAAFCFDSPMVGAEPGATAYAAVSFPPGRPILAGLLELTARIRKDFVFKPGATTVYTPVSRVMTQKAGVCQDFAHVMIAGLRGLGLPARYVSGYLRTRPPPGQPARRGADQSHAWVGSWLGPEHGWVDLDPTNNLVVRDEHVVLGWGRDYGDVSPVRGVLLGGGKHTVEVGVDLIPEDDA
jgi:transglutaminase-like putative cysteine protease